MIPRFVGIMCTSMLFVALAPAVSSLRLPFSSPTLIQPPPPKGFSWAVDVRELEGRVVKINRLVGGRSTGRTVIHPDAARTSAENQQIQALVLAARRRADTAVMRPPTSLPMSLPIAAAVVLAKLVTAELLLVKLVTAELLALTTDAVARLVVAYMSCLARLKLGVARPLRFVDGLRNGLLPADAILTLGVRPRTAGRSPALVGAAMAR